MTTKKSGHKEAMKPQFWTSNERLDGNNQHMNNSIPFCFCDRLIFKKISKLMGGRVRVMLAGGAPLSPDTHEQIKLCLCTDVIQGYGLTETTSGATVMDGENLLNNHCYLVRIFREKTFFFVFYIQILIFIHINTAKDMTSGRVGAPTTMCDIRICSWEGYRVTNKPHPQGEIIIGGDSVTRGYYKLEKKTAEDFFEEDGRR